MAALIERAWFAWLADIPVYYNLLPKKEKHWQIKQVFEESFEEYKAGKLEFDVSK